MQSMMGIGHYLFRNAIPVYDNVNSFIAQNAHAHAASVLPLRIEDDKICADALA